MEVTERLLRFNDLDPGDAAMLDRLERETYYYFREQANPRNGLVADKSQPGSPSSIAVVGLALCADIVAVERGLIDRAAAARKAQLTLEFFWVGKQGSNADSMGYRGFFYHFLDMETGARVWDCEISTMDTAILMAGALTSAQYFTGADPVESRIRELSQQLYRRIDWPWACASRVTLCHGWKPEYGFLPFFWDEGYSEAVLLYLLALGAPDCPLHPLAYQEWSASFAWEKAYDLEYFYAGPLFIHQLSHIWIDFRGIADGNNRKKGIDYFENSRRATYIHRAYAKENPGGFVGYGENNWGLTASDGPGPAWRTLHGRHQVFYDYLARGAPFGPDDGTISPWSVADSLPFAPQIVIQRVQHAMEIIHLRNKNDRGFYESFNDSFGEDDGQKVWVSPWQFGLNQAPIMLMIENYRSELIWNLMKRCEPLLRGLHRAGFRGGWLDNPHPIPHSP